MKPVRALALLALVVGAAGCRDLIELDKLAKPFACTPGGLDGGEDAGAQCGADWRCGLAGRCFAPFDTDAGRDWACELHEQCFDGWECGPRVGETRRCQRLGVGAPTACLVDDADGGCQGGWRCGADSRCFDPADPADALARDCTRDPQCPDRYRCGERVAGEQRCIEVGEGKPVPCLTDEGCEGGWRCDTLEQVCARVDDVVTSGRAGALFAVRRSPLQDERLGVPRHFAASLWSPLPAGALGVPDAPSLSLGITYAALYDGGAWVTTHLEGATEETDGGRRVLLRRWVPVSGRPEDVSHFATEHHRLHVLWRDGGLLSYDTTPQPGPVSAPVPATFLRQLSPLGSGSAVSLLDDAGFPTLVFAGRPVRDGGAEFEVYPVSQAGAPPALFSAPVDEAIPTLGPTFGFAFASGGFALARPTEDAGVVTSSSWQLDGGLTPRRVRAGLRGFQFTFAFELARRDGGADLATATVLGNSAGLTGPSRACPDAGAVPDQLAYATADSSEAAIVRCHGASLVHGDRGAGASFDAYPEDQAPFAGPVVSDYTATFGRAHAGAEGRAWFTGPVADATEDGSMLDRPLRPVLLDRQPDLFVSFKVGEQQRTLAQAGAWFFTDDPGAGLVADFKSDGFRPIAVVDPERWWIATESGLFDLGAAVARGGAPRPIASMPPGERLGPPGTGAAYRLRSAEGVREVVVLASADRVYVADLTDAVQEFGQPALLSTVLVPAPGIRLRGLTLDTRGPDTALVGYVTTSTSTWKFSTSDLVSWALAPMPLPAGSALPAELWSEGGRPRLGLADGTVWSLPIAVQLTESLRGADGGTLTTADYARKCGDLFATTREGLFHLGSGDAGRLPGWSPVPAINVAMDVPEGLRLYEVDGALLVVSRTGRTVEVLLTDGGVPQADGGACP